ncbi:MAG: tetratricopeptide repeat protein [Deltaproteobacteria bacterium]|nr:tetratricopeptide repeat protein [Deltaproteobacteria bacterium]
MSLNFSKRKFGYWQFFAVLLILGLVALTFLYGLKPFSYNDRVKRAEKFWKQNKFEEAISQYLGAVQGEPQNSKNPDLLLRVGEIYQLSLLQVARALQTYELVTVRYPATLFALQAFIHKGEIYFETSQFDKALKEYQNVLENFPKIPEAAQYRLKLAISHIKLKQFEAARRELKIILDDNLKTPLADQVLFQMGNSYFLEGNSKQALEVYQSLIQNYPKSNLVDEAKFNMAGCYEDGGEFDKALKLYQEIQSTYPNPKVIELQIARNQERRKEYEKRHQNGILEQKKQMPVLETKPMPLNSGKKTKLPMDKKTKAIIDDILKNYQ